MWYCRLWCNLMWYCRLWCNLMCYCRHWRMSLSLWETRPYVLDRESSTCTPTQPSNCCYLSWRKDCLMITGELDTVPYSYWETCSIISQVRWHNVCIWTQGAIPLALSFWQVNKLKPVKLFPSFIYLSYDKQDQ